jgi:hypothetical protein
MLDWFTTAYVSPILLLCHVMVRFTMFWFAGLSLTRGPGESLNAPLASMDWLCLHGIVLWQREHVGKETLSDECP